MKIAKTLLASASLALATPQVALAQDQFPVEGGDYVDVGMIKIDDGHALDYANFLADKWRKDQDFAKSQGWISNYQIWVNQFPRDGEADVYLITWFPKFADKAEEAARDKAYFDYMKTNTTELQTESGQRAEYRHVMGSMLFRVQEWKK